jgi:hypothetical protein|tara:strand:+ start:29 stop:523 length:495 start_codon:yes stop_codon:yes gene_type:complete
MIQLKNENVQENKVDLVQESADISDTLSVSTPAPPIVENLPKVKVCNNLKKLASFKQIKKNYKLQSQKDIFVSDVKSLLQHLDKDEHEYDIELLIEVLNACEEFFIYGNKEERNQCKVDAINELMIDYFGNDQVLNKFIGTIKNQIKKSNFLKRTFKKFKNFFL